MNLRNIVATVIVSIASFSCATSSKDITQEEAKSGVTASQSEFDANVTYNGPVVRAYDKSGLFHWEWADVHLRAVRDSKTGVTIYAVYIVNEYFGGGWKFYDSISLLGGERRRIEKLDRSVGSCLTTGCSYVEQTLFKFKTGEIHKFSLSGLKFRMNGSKVPSNQGAIVEITPKYIKGFLAGMQG